MGDASTSAAPATPTSTLICLEDGNDLFLDDDDSPADGLADSRLAADDGLLLLDRDDEYIALMLSKEGTGDGGSAGAWGEELDEWTKAARAVCVDWIVKVLRAVFPHPPIFFPDEICCQHRIFVQWFPYVCLFADELEVPVQREDGVRRGDVPRSVLGAAASRCN